MHDHLTWSIYFLSCRLIHELSKTRGQFSCPSFDTWICQTTNNMHLSCKWEASRSILIKVLRSTKIFFTLKCSTQVMHHHITAFTAFEWAQIYFISFLKRMQDLISSKKMIGHYHCYLRLCIEWNSKIEFYSHTLNISTHMCSVYSCIILRNQNISVMFSSTVYNSIFLSNESK